MEPNFGPLKGGEQIIVKGNNFKPFDPMKDINGTNDTFCDFGRLGKTKAVAYSNVDLRCPSPPNNLNPPLVSVELRVTLNNQNFSNALEFVFYNPPGLTEVSPNRGPTTGGTVVNLYGTKFNHNRDPICIFGGYTVPAKFMGPTHL